MSAIGDYIHYSSRGYGEYGVAKFREAPKINTSIFSNFKDKMLKNIAAEQNKVMSPAERLELRKRLSEIFTEDTTNAAQNVPQIQAELERLMRAQAEQSKAKVITDFNTGNLTLQQLQSIALKKKEHVLSQINTLTKEGYIYKTTIDSRINNIKNIIASIKSNTDKNTIKTQLELIEQDYKIIQNNSKNFRGTTQLYLNDEVTNLATKINSILAAFDGAVVNNVLKGDFMEYAVALSPLVGLNIGQKELNNIMANLEKTKMGDKRSQVQIHANAFSDEVDWAALAIGQKGWKYDKNKEVFTTIMPTQEKIDVDLLWNNSFVPTSIKNVNLSSGFNVHIVSNTSLLYLIQDSNQNDFINHYLNVVSTHNGTFAFDRYITGIKYIQAQNAMKLLILYKALSGKTADRQAASIFIVNDNSNSGLNSIQVYDIPSLVIKAAENLNAYTDITANGSDLSAMRLENNWATSYSTRITSLIQEVHAQKISAALKPFVLLAAAT